MIQDQINFLTRKLEVIENLIENEILNISKSAIQQAEKFPAGSANQAGVAIEAILYHIYIDKCNTMSITPKEKITIQEFKAEINKLNIVIPDTILKNIDLVQTYRNQGSHYQKSQSLSDIDLSSVLNSLIRVIEWYLEYSKGVKPDYSGLQKSINEMEYRQILRFSLLDGSISKRDREILNKKRNELNISAERAGEIEKEVIEEEAVNSNANHRFDISKYLKYIVILFLIPIIGFIVYKLLPSETDKLEKEYLSIDCPETFVKRREGLSKEERERELNQLKIAIKLNQDLYPPGMLKDHLKKKVADCKKNIAMDEKFKKLDLGNKNIEELKEIYLDQDSLHKFERKYTLDTIINTYGQNGVYSKLKRGGMSDDYINEQLKITIISLILNEKESRD